MRGLWAWLGRIKVALARFWARLFRRAAQPGLDGRAPEALPAPEEEIRQQPTTTARPGVTDAEFEEVEEAAEAAARERHAEAIVAHPATKPGAAPAEDDPYKDFVVPDDLVW